MPPKSLACIKTWGQQLRKRVEVLKKRLTWIILASVVALVVVVAVVRELRTPGSGGTRYLNLLLWTGYEEPAILNAFKKKYDVNVNYKTFVGGDAMFSLLTQSKR